MSPAAISTPRAPNRTQESRSRLTPDDALAMFVEGNARFVAGTPATRDPGARVLATSDKQDPIAVVLGCIDSRVPVETVFDQGIGDIFVARVGGNVVSGDVLGSLEFACEVAGAKALVVLGHTSCGAVTGAVRGLRLGHLTGLVEKIEPAVLAVEGDRDADDADFVDRVAEANVGLVLEEIRERSPVLSTLEEAGSIVSVGAMYDVSTGRVRFL